MSKIKRCAIYIRVSTAEQSMHGKSLPAQKEYLEKYAEENNMLVVGVYADEGKTARKELKKRKAIHELLQDVKEDKIDVILFWKMDRWFRSVSDFYKVQDILDEHSVTWIAAAERNINMETREGRLNLNIVLSIGQNEVDTTSERIKFTNENMIANGRLIFGKKNMPVGFKPGKVDGIKRMVKDEDEAPIVYAVKDYLLKYHSKRSTVKYIQDKFDYPFSYGMLQRIITSDFYIGRYRNNPNYCPAYFTEYEQKRLQEVSMRNIRTRKHTVRVYLFTGMIRCPFCNQILCGTGGKSIINRKTGEKRMYTYYRCNRNALDHLCKNNKRLSQIVIEKYLIDNLEDEFNKYMIKCKKISEEQQNNIKKKDPNKLRKELDKINLMFQKGRIDIDYYDSEYTRIENELKELQTPDEVEIKNYDYINDIIHSDFRKMYANLSSQNKQAFWHNIIKQIVLDESFNVEEVIFI